MINLNKLVKSYKKSKDNKLLEEIFINLNNIIKERAKFVFYQQDFFGTKEIKLYLTKQIELLDVIQDLNLFILKLIKNYDIKQPFENYLFRSLKFYKPSFINKEFIKTLKTQSIYQMNKEGEEENIAEEKLILEYKEIEFNEPLTEKEQEIFDLIKEDMNLTQEDIAKELGISQQSVSIIIASIKEKIQK